MKKYASCAAMAFIKAGAVARGVDAPAKDGACDVEARSSIDAAADEVGLVIAEARGRAVAAWPPMTVPVSATAASDG